MSFFLSPIGNSQQFDANGNPLNAGKIYTYLAGSTTPTATYTDNTGATPQANPIILNSLGLSASPIWLNGGITYKLVIKDSNDVTLRTVDNVSGINDITATQTEWVSSGFVPTYISAVSFSVPGDQTGTLQIGRRLRTQNTSGTVYSTISNSVFAATITTVTVTNDSTVLDSGLSSVAYGVAAPISPSLPNSAAVRSTMGITSAYQAQEGIAYTTAGTSTAYTLTPSPAITAYVAGQSFFVTFNAASGAAPTLAISAIATPPNLVKQNADGSFSNIAANDIFTNHRSRVTLLSATQAWVETLPRGKQLAQNLSSTTGAVATGTTVIPLDDTIPQVTEGDQYLSLAITPTNAASTLEVEAVLYLSSNQTPAAIIAALFKDGAANAVTADSIYQPTGNGMNQIKLRYTVVSGSTSATTFTVRCGANVAGTTTLNGAAGLRLLGGVGTSYINIKEYLS